MKKQGLKGGFVPDLCHQIQFATKYVQQFFVPEENNELMTHF